MQKLAIILLFSYVLMGCASWPSAGWHLKQAKRNIRKAELKGATWSADTVLKEVTVFVPSVRYDTLFKSEPGDTVTIFKNRLQIKYVRLPKDSVYIEGKCDSIVVTKIVPVQVIKEITAPPSRMKWWHWLLIGVGTGLILAIVLRR